MKPVTTAGVGGIPCHTQPTTPPAMAYDHPDSPKQFGIRLSEETMKLVSEVQHYRQRTNQPITLSAVVEDAIRCHHSLLIKEGALPND